MNHTFFTRSKLNECTEFFDAYNSTFKNLSCFEICCDRLDHFLCFIHTVLVNTADRYCSFICNVNLYTCTLDDRVDGLSSLTYYITDLLRIDLDLNDLRCIFVYMITRLCDTFFHNLCEDVLSCFFCSADCFFYNLSCQAMDLDIHLNCSDTVMCTCNLKVHISEEVFQALDICQNDVIIICSTCYQTTGNTCNRFTDRYTCCHKRHSRCTDTCLRSRTVRFECLRYCTDCVREFLC